MFKTVTQTPKSSSDSEGAYVYTLYNSTKTQESLPHILIVPGWGESAKVAMTLAKDLHKSGNKVSIIEYGNLDDVKKSAKCNIEKKYPVTERARACAVINFINSQKEKIHIVAHSQGAIAAMLSTTSDIKNIGTTILIAPAGIVLLKLNQLIFRYIKSFIIQLRNVLKTGNSLGKQYFTEVSQYISYNPIQLGRDAYGIAGVDIIPLLINAKMQNKAVRIVCNSNDRIFPIDKIRDRVQSLYSVHSIKGDHDAIYIDVKPFTKYINSVLKV